MLKSIALLLTVGIIGGAAASPLPKFQLIHRGKGTARAAVGLATPDADPAPPSPPGPLPPPSPPNPQPDPTPPDPPSLTLPATVEGNAGEFLKVTADTNGDHVRWVSMDKGLAVFPGEMLKDSTSTVVLSTTGGQYRLLAYTALADVPSDPVICMVVVHGPQPPPAPIPVPPAPGPAPAPAPAPIPPPPAPTPPQPTAIPLTSLGVVTVDNGLATTPSVAAVLGDVSFWNSLKAQGIQYIKYNATDPAALQNPAIQQAISKNISAQYPSGVPTILVIDMRVKTHNWANQDPADLKFPATTVQLKALLNKFAGGQVK